MDRLIRDNISSVASQEFDLVVGIPRSGVIPAYMIALYLNIPVCLLDDFINNNRITHGDHRQVKSGVEFPHDATNILLVDDSYNTGGSLKGKLEIIPERLNGKVKTMAVFSSSDVSNLDFYLEIVPLPRAFEWNIMHHNKIIPRSCFDIDGVLCEDPTEEQNDDGEKYIDFIRNATPKYIPTYSIKTIVTSRLEKYREDTVEWLNNNGVKYEKLVMLEGYTADERKKAGVHGSFKAEEYRKDEYTLFFESNLNQSYEISRLTNGKPVYCVGKNVMVCVHEEDKEAKVRRDGFLARLKDVAKKSKIASTLLRFPYKLARHLWHFIKR